MRATRILCLAILLVCGLAAVSSAQMQTLPMGSEKTELTLLGRDGDTYLYRARIGELQALDVATQEGTFTRLFIPGFHQSMREGAPELPMMNRLVEVPTGAIARVVVLSQTTRTLSLADYGIEHPVFPAQPSMPKNADPATWPFVLDRSAYAAPRVAQDLLAVTDVGQLRSVHVGRLEVSPVEYYPAENRLLVHDTIDFQIVFEGGDAALEKSIKINTYSPFFEGLYGQVEGFRGQHDLHPDLVRDVVTMVVVTPSQYAAQMQPFVNWKRTRGFHMIVGVLGTPEVGTTTTSIQTYLRGLYNSGTPEQPAPSFVLFVGDVDVMPTWTLDGNPTDRPYCAVDADLMPEMYYGRFSCANPTQLQNMLDKTLMYDQFTMPDPSYLNEAVMIAGVDGSYGQVWANGQINYGTTYYFNASHGILSHTYLYPQSGSMAAQIVQNVSDGVAYANYTAHGSETGWANPAFTQTNVNNLQNNGQYCLAVGNCCLTSKYSYGECFAETWLRVANKGAIGYIGGSNNTYWDEDYWWGVGYRSSIVEHPVFDANHMGAYDGVFHDHSEPMTKWYVTNDALVFCGNLAVTESGSSRITYYWNIYNLMGDPSLSTFLGVPSANPVSHPAAILTTSTSVDITATPNSYAGLTKDGVLIGAGTVGATGTLELPIWEDPLTPGTAHLVVMAQNRVPYQADIEVVAPNGPFLVHAGTVIDDDPSGDCDGLCDAGETVDMILTLRNAGVEPATGITAVISTADPYAEILVNTRAYPDLPAGAQGASLGAYCLSFASETPDDHQITLDLAIHSAQGNFQRAFRVTVGRPSLAFSGRTVDDAAPLGNGTGWLVPWEAASLTLTLANAGHANARNATLVLSGLDPFIEIIQGTGACGDVPAGGQAALSPIQIRILGDCPVPTVLNLHATVTADFGYSSDIVFDLPVGGFADDVEADRGWTLGAPGDNATSGQWVTGDPVATVYNGNPVQPEDDHTPAPGVRCFVTGNGTPGGPAGDSDVDGGTTTLLTPVFDLEHVDGASVSYWVYYTNDRGNSPSQDYWDVQITNNGTNWVSLEHTTTSTNAWVQRTFQVADHVSLSDQVQIRFVAQDQSPGSLVDALIDDFVLIVSEPAPPPPAGIEDAAGPNAHFLAGVQPNPMADAGEIQFRLALRAEMNLRVFDVSGALVRTLFRGTGEAGEHRVTWDGRNNNGNRVGAGVYFLRLDAPGFAQVRPIVLVD